MSNIKDLCDDVLHHIALFLCVIDIINLSRVFNIFSSESALRALVKPMWIDCLSWTYERPPDTIRFSAFNVIEIPSLEPQYFYRSFAQMSFTRGFKDTEHAHPPLRRVSVDVIHIHNTWITEEPHPQPIRQSASYRACDGS